jgi:hypothetical protein
MQGFGFVEDISQRRKRTGIMEQEADSREAMRDATIARLEDALLDAQIQRAREWDYREEAPVVAEGPSSGLPQQKEGAETTVPRTQNMPAAPGTSEGPSTEHPTQQGQGPAPTEGGMAGPGGPGPVPIIQGTEIPGDRFKRVPVPGGSTLERPRSFHQKRGALEEAHGELYPGRDMSGVSEALAMGMDPYQERARGARTPEESLQLYKDQRDYDLAHPKPSAGDEARAFKQGENKSEAYAASLVGQGVDMMEALEMAERETGIYPDATLVQKTLDANYNRLMSIYRYIGVPENNWQAHAIRSIAVGGMSRDEALYDYTQAADPTSEFGITDPVTGETRKMTVEELQEIIDYIDKYGAVDTRAANPFEDLYNLLGPQGFQTDSVAP